MHDFEKGGGAGNSKNLRRIKLRMNIVSLQFSPIFCPKLGEDQKKRSSLKISPIFCSKLCENQKKKVFTQNLLDFFWCQPQTNVFPYHLCAQSFCSTHHYAICILINANYPGDPKGGGGHGPMAPPKYAHV